MNCEACGSRKKRGLFVLEQKTSSDKREWGGWCCDIVLCYECEEKLEKFISSMRKNNV